ncbi:MAG: SHOCT domain-containing protein [Bacillota bacterium]|nr:SHOCT domain-containing protein [Bacillota bacterium]
MLGTAVGIVKKTVGAVAKISITEVAKVADGVKAVSELIVPDRKRSLAEVTEDLKRLKELRDLGILTEEEFEEKKKKYMEML